MVRPTNRFLSFSANKTKENMMDCNQKLACVKWTSLQRAWAKFRQCGDQHEETYDLHIDKVRDQIDEISSDFFSDEITFMKNRTEPNIQWNLGQRLFVQLVQFSVILEPYMRKRTTYKMAISIKLAKNSSVVKMVWRRKLLKTIEPQKNSWAFEDIFSAG